MCLALLRLSLDLSYFRFIRLAHLCFVFVMVSFAVVVAAVVVVAVIINNMLSSSLVSLYLWFTTGDTHVLQFRCDMGSTVLAPAISAVLASGPTSSSQLAAAVDCPLHWDFVRPSEQADTMMPARHGTALVSVCMKVADHTDVLVPS